MEFNKHVGLCRGIDLMYPNAPAVKGCYSAVEIEIINQFGDAGLRRGFPFGVHDFSSRAAKGTQHQCPKRLAWVLDHIDNPPANQSKELLEFYKAWYKWATETI